ncbi:Uncharacterized protein Adt_43325 [Abeliophyllum distichum]|uniref:Polyprotein n=1 Tax=Abeliophyllum distichum TaxID=126358 RepID=A0ABD1P7P1_9LAMI
MTVSTYYEAGTSALLILSPRQEMPNKYFLVHRSYGHSMEECCEVKNLANRRETSSGPRQGTNMRCGAQSLMRGRRPPGPDRHYLHGSLYIGGQSQNVQKSNAKEAEEKLMTNWLINSRSSGSSKVDPISFTEEDMRRVHYLYYDALVVRAVVARNGLGRMLVDNGSSVNVIFLSTYEQMNINVPLEPSTEPLYGFTGDCVTLKRIVRLAVTMGEEPLAIHTFMKFLVVDRRGVATIRCNQPEARKFYRNALRKVEKKEVNMTIRDIEMEEASEETPQDVEMEEALSPEDIDPSITGTDSQTSSVKELENFPGRSP